MNNEEHRFLQKRKFKLLSRWSSAPESYSCRLRQVDPGRFRSLIFHAFDDLLTAAREGGGNDPLANRSPLLVRFNLSGDHAESDFNAILRAGGRVLYQFAQEAEFSNRFGPDRLKAVEESIILAISRMQRRERNTIEAGGLITPFSPGGYDPSEEPSNIVPPGRFRM